tara:strand:- start:118 stop:393 length:276 start_codon:yes stop_codon:yes gene_type:complete
MIIPKAIKAINPNAEFSITDNNLDNITWLNGTTPISVLDIQNKINEIQYQLDREAEYPSWQEQMDMQYHDTVNGTTTWKDAIAKVKSDNPK